jgi:predicted metal-binding protein
MKNPTPDIQRPRWQAVLLVCKECGKRSNGPKHLKPKEVAALARRGSKHAKTRTRVLMTTCMGLCPKSAIALAAAGADATRIVAISKSGQVEQAVARLTADARTLVP